MTTKRELRLALGMRGGVSLAVWIGGACAEIDKLRRATLSDPPSTFWRDLLKQSAYEQVVVDVFAGASAGGLNGALYASSLVYGFPLDEVREVWLASGNTDVLLRDGTPSLSLFDGDGVFLQRVYENLRRVVERADTSEAGTTARTKLAVDHLSLSLSATLVEQVERLDSSPTDEEEWQRRSASGFHFEHHREPWRRNDFPATAVGDEPRRSALARLALSARATSSFPGAFEPAIVHSGRPERFSAFATVPAGSASSSEAFRPGDVDLDGAFLDRVGAPKETFLVADGGILDNIPLSRAIRDIVAAPAGGPTSRVLLYLHPGVPTRRARDTTKPSTPDPDRERQRRAVPALARGVVKAFRSEETIGQDMAAIEHHGELVRRAGVVRAGTFMPLLPGSGATGLVSDGVDDAARAAYAQQRGFDDAQRIAGVLGDPIAALERDPFPRTAGGAAVEDNSWRSPLGRLTAAQRQVLTVRLWQRYGARAARTRRACSAALRVDIAPIQRVTSVLLDCAWSIEARGGSVGVGEQKERLYRILNFAGELLAAPRNWAWVAAAAVTLQDQEAASPISFVDRTLRWTDDLYRLDPSIDPSALITALRNGSDDALIERYRVCVLEHIDELVAGIADPTLTRPAPLEPEEDIRTAVLLPLLEEVATDLRERGSADAVLHPGHFIEAYLVAGGAVDTDTLARLEILCHPEFVTGRPCQSEIEFRRLSAANRVPIAPSFMQLAAAAETTGKWWDPSKTPAEQRGIHVDLKLAGNELANFAAFLLPEWRANDWLWGRLDAVPTLIDLLVTPRALIAAGIVGDPGMAPLQELAIPPAGQGASGEAIECIEAFFASQLTRVGEELDALAAAATTLTEPDVDITGIRDVLIARRQWEILDEELRLTRRAASDVPRAGTRPLTGPESRGREGQPVSLAAAVKHYDSGAQTTREPEGYEQAKDRSAALHDRFDELVEHGTRTIVDNLDARQGGPVSTSLLTGTLGKLAVRLLRLVAILATRAFLPTKKGKRAGVTGTAAIVITGVAAGAGVYAWSRDWIAFVVGIVLVIGVIAAFLWFTRKRAKK